MCDKMNREKELKEAVDSLTTALEKEFGTPEERSKKRYTFAEMVEEDEKMIDFCKRWRNEL